MLAQSQRFFIASKPRSLPLIIIFWLSSRQMSRRCCERFTDEVRSHNVTTGITRRFSVTSVTSSPRLLSTTIFLWNFNSHSTVQRSTQTCRWLLSNSNSHRLNRVCTTLWLSFWETFYSHFHKLCNYINFLTFTIFSVSNINIRNTIILVRDDLSNWLFVFQ